MQILGQHQRSGYKHAICCLQLSFPYKEVLRAGLSEASEHNNIHSG